MVEDLALARSGRGDEVLVQNVKDVLADLSELGLDLLAVGLDHRNLGLVTLGLLLLLDGGDDAPRGTAGTNDVLVGDREEVALLNGKLLVGGSDALHVLNHLCGMLKSSTSESRSVCQFQCHKAGSYLEDLVSAGHESAFGSIDLQRTAAMGFPFSGHRLFSVSGTKPVLLLKSLTLVSLSLLGELGEVDGVLSRFRHCEVGYEKVLRMKRS